MFGTLLVGVRPEYLALATEGDAGALPATVAQVQDVGTYWLLTAQVAPGPGAAAGTQPATVRLRLESDQQPPAAGSPVWLAVMGEHSCLYADDELVDPIPAPEVSP